MAFDIKKGEYDRYVVTEKNTLLNWLLANLKGMSKNKIKDTLAGQGIKVNGKIVTKYDYPLIEGMKIAVSKTKRNNLFKSKYVDLLYEDNHIMVILKKAGILSMPVGKASLNVKMVLDDYLTRSKQKCNAHVVHRLDRDTSGLMVYAKDKRVEQLFEEDWHNIVYDRRYMGVVSGEVLQNEGTIANWLKDNKAYVTYSSPYDNGGKYAVTHFRVLKRNANYSLIEYKLETGRKNQIRVHSADMGYPICGDVKYGNGDNPIGRLCLHAYVLAFYHPVTGKRMEFETPVPSDFNRVVK